MRVWIVAALLALSGCIVEESSSPRTVTAEATGPGLAMNATVVSEGRTHTLTVVTRNVGSQSYNVSSICAPVHTHHIEKDGVRVWPEPEAVCLAYGVKPFPPGATESVSASWDESTDGGARAAPGTYVWNVAFHYQEDEASGWTNVTLAVPFEVR